MNWRVFAIRLTLSLGLSAVLLWLAFRHVQIAPAWDVLRKVDRWLVGVYVASLIVTQFCRVLRWGVLIRPFAQVSTAVLMRVSHIGLFLVLVLPLRLGEFGRPYLLKRATGASMSSGIASVAVERTFDGLVITLMFFVSTTILGAAYPMPTYLRAGGVIALGIFGGASVVIVAALLSRQWATQQVQRIGNRISPGLTHKLVALLHAFIDGLQALPNIRAVATFLAFTLVYWLINGFGFYVVAVSLGWNLPLVAGFFIVSVLGLGMMIPAGPGLLGSYQAALLVGLSVLGIDANGAAAFGFVVYPLSVLVIVAFGVGYLLTGGVDILGAMRVGASTENKCYDT